MDFCRAVLFSYIVIQLSVILTKIVCFFNLKKYVSNFALDGIIFFPFFCQVGGGWIGKCKSLLVFGLPYIISISLNLYIQLELGNDLVICLTIGSSTHIFRYKHYTNKYSKTWTFSWRPVAFSKICIVFFLLAVLIQDLLCLIQN